MRMERPLLGVKDPSLIAARTRNVPPWRRRRTRRLNFERGPLPGASVALATVVHVPLTSFWMATGWPSLAGVTVPEKRTRLPRRMERELTFVETLTLTPTVTIGLTTSGLEGISTRYWVFTPTERTG